MSVSYHIMMGHYSKYDSTLVMSVLYHIMMGHYSKYDSTLVMSVSYHIMTYLELQCRLKLVHTVVINTDSVDFKKHSFFRFHKCFMCENITVKVSEFGGMLCQVNCNIYLMLFSEIFCSWLKTSETTVTGIKM